MSSSVGVILPNIWKKSNHQTDLLAKLRDSRDQLDLDLPSLTLCQTFWSAVSSTGVSGWPLKGDRDLPLCNFSRPLPSKPAGLKHADSSAHVHHPASVVSIWMGQPPGSSAALTPYFQTQPWSGSLNIKDWLYYTTKPLKPLDLDIPTEWSNKIIWFYHVFYPPNCRHIMNYDDISVTNPTAPLMWNRNQVFEAPLVALAQLKS